MVNDRFEVEFTRQAEKDLNGLRGQAGDALRIISGLADNPERGHTLSGSLPGARSLEFNLQGSGAYRALYVIHPAEGYALSSLSAHMRASMRGGTQGKGFVRVMTS